MTLPASSTGTRPHAAHRGEDHDLLVERWDLCFEDGHCAGIHRSLFVGTSVCDAHAHLGRDRDGHELSAEGLIARMDRFGVEQAVVFPLDDPGGRGDFRAANAAVLEASLRCPDRLVPFFRLSPWSDWQPEYERWLRWGFRGIKLHPRAQRFPIDGATVDPIFARAEADGIPVLIHTGLGCERPAAAVDAVAGRHPSLPLILGHSCFAELDEAIRLLGARPNVFFETSVVPVYDLARLLERLGPARLLLGSDEPYRSLAVSLQALVGAAMVIGAERELLRPVLGGTLMRLLEGRAL